MATTAGLAYVCRVMNGLGSAGYEVWLCDGQNNKVKMLQGKTTAPKARKVAKAHNAEAWKAGIRDPHAVWMMEMRRKALAEVRAERGVK